MFFEEICKPRIADFGKGGKLSLTAVMAIMEDAGSHQCTYVGDDVLESSLSGSAWVCTNWRIRIRKMPAGGQDLKVCTWARTNESRSTVLRDYTISSGSGTPLIIAEAKFVRMDIFAGKPVRITEKLYQTYQPEDKTIFEDEMTRLTEPEEYDCEMQVALRESDVDFNGHVHNIRYLDIAAAGVPEGGKLLRKAAEINIAYRRALTESDKVVVRSKAQEDGRFISIANEKGSCCLIHIS